MQLALNHYLGAARVELEPEPAKGGDARRERPARERACTVIVHRDAQEIARPHRSRGRWLHRVADGTGAKVYLAGGSGRWDCLRTPPLELRKELAGPKQWNVPAGAPPPEDHVLEFDAASRPHLAYGWSGLESQAGRTYAWVEGKHAAVDLFLRGGGDRILVVDLWTLAVGERQQRVEISLNGTAVASASVNPLGERLTVGLPGELLRDGENRIAFSFRWVATPRRVGLSDDRHLAAAFDRLEVR
jgi:hypothetical protein